jgi:hypothetical protein
VITVLSTANAAPTREECLRSVRSQRGVDFEHIYIDAAEQHPPKGAMQNVVEAMATLPDDRIVCFVDGDDHLLRDDALLLIERLYRATGALVSYGSFRFSDGRGADWQRSYLPGENVRTADWRASHLKTMRASIFKRIRHEDLKMNGKWLEHFRDGAVMLPAVELASSRAVWCPEIVYAYHFANSTEFTGGPEALAAEKVCVEYVRSLPPYAALESP